MKTNKAELDNAIVNGLINANALNLVNVKSGRIVLKKLGFFDTLTRFKTYWILSQIFDTGYITLRFDISRIDTSSYIIEDITCIDIYSNTKYFTSLKANATGTYYIDNIPINSGQNIGIHIKYDNSRALIPRWRHVDVTCYICSNSENNVLAGLGITQVNGSVITIGYNEEKEPQY